MDDVTWGALTITLTVLAGAWSWHAFRRRGLASGLRGVGLALLPLAAFLTDTLRMFTRIGGAIGDWAVGLALSPVVWVGIVLAGLTVVLFGVAGLLDRRRGGRASRAVGKAEPATGRLGAPHQDRRAAPAPGAGSGDPEMDEIEALLRKRGIS